MLPRSLSERSWAPLLSILDGFGMKIHGFGHHFSRICLLFCSSICRVPTPHGTKRNDGKRQEHAGNCRNMQKLSATKNSDIETPIENLQAAECNQLQQTPIFKIGGGGARAARRIQIHIWRRFQTMCVAKRCQKTKRVGVKTFERR